jgi:D-3-phosphoglycerate dehydrogenase
MPEPKFVATGPVPPIVHQILGRVAPLEVAPQTDEASLIALMPGTIGLVARADTAISAPVIEAGSSLKVIGRTGVGYEKVDIACATARGVPVILTPGAAARAVAESTLGAILALTKKLFELDVKARFGDWNARNTTSIGDLSGATLGLVGLGHIAREVARLALAFDMRIVGYDPFVSPADARQFGVETCGLDDVFALSDVVSLHVGLLPETQGMVDRRRLKLMKPGSILVNYARGGLFESLDAVYEALCSGTIAAAAIDVYPTEPPDTKHPIFRHPQVLFTPHSGGLSKGAFDRMGVMMSESMIDVLEGRQPQNVANPDVYLVRQKGGRAVG